MRFFEHVNEISCRVKDVRFIYSRGKCQFTYNDPTPCRGRVVNYRFITYLKGQISL